MATDEEESVASSTETREKSLSSSSKESFALYVLQMIRSSQQQHGLRHGDFQRYRQYCARRLRRTRKALHFPQGSKYKVTPKKVKEEILNDIRYLHIPLVEAERAWSFAMQLKNESNTEHRKKFHMISRLRKAVYHADLLATLCESDKVDACTKLEAQAYAAGMKAALNFEQENWKTSMEFFTKAKTIYEKLAGAFVDEQKDVYLQRVEEISPNIRYCAYNIGDESAIEDLRQMRLKTGAEDPLTSRLDELIEKTREKQSATLSEVTWRGRTVPVRNEQVRVYLLSVQDTDRQLAEIDTIDGKLSIYESLMKELVDAQQSLRDELKDDPHFKAFTKGQILDDKVPNSVYLYSHLMYLKQTKTIERNLLMIESLKHASKNPEEGKKAVKPQDLARLYDIITQNLSEIPNLPGLEEDFTLGQEIEAQIIGYKAFRCFYVAQSYANAKKWREAIALYEQVLNYINDALKGYKNISRSHTNNKQERVSELEELKKEVDGIKYSVRASSILDLDEVTDGIATLSVKNSKPLIDRLEMYAEDPGLTSKKPNLAHFPPDFEAVACKPLFFDLALNHIDFPSLEDKMEQKKQAGGITGLVKGWFWGGGKK